MNTEHRRALRAWGGALEVEGRELGTRPELADAGKEGVRNGPCRALTPDRQPVSEDGHLEAEVRVR